MSSLVVSSEEKRPIMDRQWIESLRETVSVSCIFRECPYQTEEIDKAKHSGVLRRLMGSDRFDTIFPPVEGTLFWLGGETDLKMFTVVYAYFERYIINPECCKNNPSTIACYVRDMRTCEGELKIKKGRKMLDEILQMEKTLFPQDGDESVFSKVDHIFEQYLNQCSTCGVRYDRSACTECLKHKIIREELLHKEDLWENTGYKGVFRTRDLLYLRPESQYHRFLVLSKPISGDLTYPLLERSTVKRFMNCGNTQRVPKLTVVCYNVIGERLLWEREKLQYLPLPTIEKKSLGHFFSSTGETVKKIQKFLLLPFPLLTSKIGIFSHGE